MRVLVIPEDRTYDQYIIKPVVEAMFSEEGVSARVEVLADPHLSGVDQATDKVVLSDIVRDNQMVHLFLLVIDRDCDRKGLSARVAEREKEHPSRLIGCLAVNEIECWMLALQQNLNAGVAWADIRGHCDPKERYAEPYLESQGWTSEVGGGRKRAMRALSGNWKRLVSRCAEVADLQLRVRRWIGARRSDQASG